MSPGMFIYLRDRKVRPSEFHPFSISSVNYEMMTFTIYIKALGDWTIDFVEKVQRLSTMTLNESAPETLDITAQVLEIDIEGPYKYNSISSMSNYNRCIFFAGGVGLTGICSSIIQRHHDYQQPPWQHHGHNQHKQCQEEATVKTVVEVKSQ